MTREIVFEIENTTPILMGGYNEDAVAEIKANQSLIKIREKLRPSSIKGVWRWWARALVAAAYHRRFGRHLDIKQADELISPIFGTTSIPSTPVHRALLLGVSRIAPGYTMTWQI